MVSETGAAQAMISEAQRLQRLERVPEAIAAYERIVTRWPQLADCWYNLGLLQRRARQLTAALDSYAQALDRGISGPEEVHLNRGVIYADYLRDDAAAERELQAALAINPQFAPALLNLANLYEDLGRRDAACTVYRRLLTFNPRHYEALARYANLRPADDVDDDLIADLRSAISRPDTSLADQASLGFALGRLLDARGIYSAAFDAYAAANRTSRASALVTTRYDRREQERLVDRLIASATPLRARASPQSLQPIFVCGMFRSGSTLAERLLAGHPQVTAGGELDFLPHAASTDLAPFPESLAAQSLPQLEALAARYLADLASLFPAARYVTDKRPDNFLYIGLIKTLFPDAKIVHTVRSPLDNCLSVYFLHLDQRMTYALDLMDIGHYYREYRRLMSHWKSRYGADIVDLDYDQLVRDPAAVAARFFAALGFEWRPEFLEFPGRGGSVKTASNWQVREPLYRHASGRAAHYETQLAALRDYLADFLAPCAASKMR